MRVLRTKRLHKTIITYEEMLRKLGLLPQEREEV